MSRYISTAVIVMALAMGAAGAAVAQGAQPVRIGGDAKFDACGSLGQVSGLKRHGDNFLSVRTGPATEAREVDRLRQKTMLNICEESGDWLGIVYSPAGQTVDCGVSSPVATRVAYRGPCRSGWVHKRFVTNIAG